MLKVKFMQYKNVVVMEILEQSKEDQERLFCRPFVASNDFALSCGEQPEIVDDIDVRTIYLIGNNVLRNTTCYDFKTEENAKDFIEEALLAIKEYNKRYEPKNNVEEFCCFNITVAE